jgi:mandelate racemase
MRDAVGGQIEIMADYNQSLSVAEAIHRVQHLEAEGVAWIEEPVLAHDFHGMAEVAAAARTPIQAGENWWGPLEVRQAIAVHATDLVMPDVMKIGGVTGWMRTSAMAQAHGLRVSNHLFPEISAQLMCATPTAHLLEYADWWNPVVERPLELRAGVAVIADDVKGTGVSWNEEVVSRYLV